MRNSRYIIVNKSSGVIMALIKCPECGKDVSDTIKSCIHCGFVLPTKNNDDLNSAEVSETKTDPVVSTESKPDITSKEKIDNSKDDSSVGIKFLIGIIVTIGILIFFSAIADSCVNTNLNTTVATTAPILPMDLLFIKNDIEENEIRAKETHEGKRYRITAKVEQVTERYVVVSSPVLSRGSYAVKLYHNNQSFVKSISKDDIITFEGTLTNIYSSIHMEFRNVVFVEKSE